MAMLNKQMVNSYEWHPFQRCCEMVPPPPLDVQETIEGLAAIVRTWRFRMGEMQSGNLIDAERYWWSSTQSIVPPVKFGLSTISFGARTTQRI